MENKINTKIALFEAKKIRKLIYRDEWWFSIIDIIEFLTETYRPRKYWNDLKAKLIREGYIEVSEKIGQFKLIASDGKMRETDCANTKTILRIVQTIPSPKAEPLKIWLAQVGTDRIAEIENPELAMDRMKSLYEKKGYPKDWIDKRARGIAVRHTLTDEWKNRGVKHSVEYAILTDEIMQGTFDMKVSEYKKFKGLNRENLRDHMDDLELILTMLGEATTTRLTKDRNSKGFPKLKNDAKDGGSVAGQTRKNIEAKTKTNISSSANFNNLNTKQIK
ncbi:phage antirepressor protein [Candidatus Shapirobacteria bacterium CG06_land_8_20_14_3_00_40_12]|uniref:Phage antirepressor protein n=2 Tax=Candidatus Shapironibacteriota TaxID=1752721 RepID=A0A2M7TSG0_9BACT|nr:MAG: phage antirepressor protein [Candidatus Shapirobacteria bacterium CG06_land_8_20_14_3_00_40_12]PIZ58669.1 MAG: phage antirepressor protein [Candidatus Shapirobacteria bacterium CG_4_10_14_0_2_um_filter_40_12]